MKRPIITLLTDFGSGDHYVGTMKGVILRICPEAQIVDISHEVRPYAIAEAAFTLAQAWPYFPKGTIHLIVVDPGVGSARRPLIAEARGHRFVAPDNGVVSMLYDATPSHKIREITASRYFLKPVSRTFHGRDIFAPVAAHLARGVASARIGKEITEYVRLSFAQPVQIAPGIWHGSILKIDRYGNIVSNFESETWQRLAAQPFEMKVNNRVLSRLASNYAEMDPKELYVIAGSSGFLEISMREESAAAAVGAASGQGVELRLTK